MKRLIEIFAILFCLSAIGVSQIPFPPKTSNPDSIPSDIFEGESILRVNIFANYDSILDDAARRRSVQRPAKLQILSSSGIITIIEILLETRGNFRMKTENCDFPPLRISYPRDDSAREVCIKNRTIKLVTQCQSYKPDYEQYLLEEYLIYKIYAYLSEYAFRVRLLKINYINQGHRFDTLSRYCFALETPREMTKRLNAKRISSTNVQIDKINLWQYKLICFFQYMIMNNDWSIAICHNIELIQPDPFNPPIPVPFDFDWAGIINVPYIVPSAQGRTTIQPERSFKGDFKTRRELKSTIRYFKSRQGGIYAIVSGFKDLDKDYRIQFISSLDEFYTIMNSYFEFRKKIIKKK